MKPQDMLTKERVNNLCRPELKTPPNHVLRRQNPGTLSQAHSRGGSPVVKERKMWLEFNSIKLIPGCQNSF